MPSITSLPISLYVNWINEYLSTHPRFNERWYSSVLLFKLFKKTCNVETNISQMTFRKRMIRISSFHPNFKSKLVSISGSRKTKAWFIIIKSNVHVEMTQSIINNYKEHVYDVTELDDKQTDNQGQIADVSDNILINSDHDNIVNLGNTQEQSDMYTEIEVAGTTTAMTTSDVASNNNQDITHEFNDRESQQQITPNFTNTHHPNTTPINEPTDIPSQYSSKFKSPEALKMFLPTTYFENKAKGVSIIENQEKTIKKYLQQQLVKFHEGWLCVMGWKQLLFENDDWKLYSDSDIFVLRNKCKYLYFGTKSLLLNYHHKSSIECFQLAIDEIREFEFDSNDELEFWKITSPSSMSRWFHTYNLRGTFVQCKKAHKDKLSFPPFLDNNPDIKNAIMHYCLANLETLSAESACDYIKSTCFPTLLQTRKSETHNSNMSIDDILKENGLKSLCVRTVNNWLRSLGFQYSERKKCYYNDKHESKENIIYRKKFIQRYLEREIYSYRWIQLPIHVYNKMIDEGEILNGIGYKFNNENDNNNTYIEFHVDDHPSFAHSCYLITSFGGNLSVKFPLGSKPIIIFGQDECIFKQYAFRKKGWTGPNGERPLMPKDDGQGLMISAFVSREFGFGWEITSEQLELVNARRFNTNYNDQKAAIIINGSPKKNALTSSPFVRKLQYGAKHEGYWSYEDMIIQVEDCIDCLKEINGDKFRYLFMFDHSNGHDRVCPDALNAMAISKKFGGSQPSMRDSTIVNNNYLGPHDHSSKLKVGEIQTMSFKSTDAGPFYLSEKEKASKKYDKTKGTKEIKLRKSELISKLELKGIKNPKGCIQKLHKLCSANNIDIKKTVADIEHGWVKRPKGAFQILFERGWIDTNINTKKYTWNGTLDEYGNKDESKSIKLLIRAQVDFIEQETLIQHHCAQMGIETDRSPVAHPEIAGDGIEFDWAMERIWYRKQPWESKKKRISSEIW